MGNSCFFRKISKFENIRKFDLKKTISKKIANLSSGNGSDYNSAKLGMDIITTYIFCSMLAAELCTTHSNVFIYTFNL